MMIMVDKLKKIAVFLLLMFVVVIATSCKDTVSQSGHSYEPMQSDSSPFNVSVSVDFSKTFASNKRLLGNNVQWIDRGDELLKAGTGSFSPVMLQKVIELRPTVLRYPGGSLSDLYHWKNGVGAIRNRKKSSRFHSNGDDTILFGTREFLELCKLTGAEPLLTANIVTAPASETIDWIKKVNFERFRDASGKVLPKVGFLEIGNEPYLIDDNQKKLALSAKQFAARATELVSKLRKVDPTVKIGIPLRSDDFDGFPATPLPGFNKEVLKRFSGKIDFVALHNAYFPFLWSNIPSNKEQIYLASMAAVSVVKKDLDKTRQQLKAYRSESNIPIAITEMNSMFSIGRGESDGYIQTLTGAMYIADLLTLFSKESNILMANFWSLTGNWQFGAIGKSGEERPAYKVLSKFHDMLNGKHVRTVVQSPTFNVVKTGIVSAQQGVSYLTVLGSVTQVKGQKKTLKLWVLNKHPLKEASMLLELGNNATAKTYVLESLTAKDYLSVAQAKRMVWKKSEKTSFSKKAPIKLAPHSLNLITIEM